LFRLDNEIAVVTGALGRLGPVWTGALLEAGAAVAAVDLPARSPPGAFQALLERYPRDRLRLYSADIRSAPALESARERCTAELGAPTVIVNNAGIDQPPGKVHGYRLTEIPPQVVEDIFRVNLLGAFQVMQTFGAAMLARGRGSIINIGSLYAEVSPDPRLYDHIACAPPFLKPPAYGASKAALVNLTRYFAAHWGPHGIRVNTLSPGGVAGGQDEEFTAKFGRKVPMGRMADPAELTGPLVFLASPASSYVTGINLMVDGGFTVW
jgi:NAD(P)-dependent dehydrogenase (short-subunit alcohol dehydrogenase family)